LISLARSTSCVFSLPYALPTPTTTLVARHRWPAHANALSMMFGMLFSQSQSSVTIVKFFAPRELELLVDQLEEALLRERHLLARLHDDRVARRDGVREEPERHHRREVVRRDDREHAHRLADAHAVDARGELLEGLAHHQGRHARRRLDVLEAPPDVALRLVERLAVLLRTELAELVHVLDHQVAQVEHVPGARGDGHVTPGLERLLRGPDRGVHVRRRAHRDGAELLQGSGVRDVEGLAPPRLHPLAADVVLHLAEIELHGSRSLLRPWRLAPQWLHPAGSSRELAALVLPILRAQGGLPLR
jgi:hypothetical protein